MNFTKMKKPIAFRMYADIEFNRPVKTDGSDYIVPGGFEMNMSGKMISFDFEDFEGMIDKKNPCILHAKHNNPDYGAFEELNNLSEKDLRNVSEVAEFFVYTGEKGESDLEAISVHSITFVLPYKNWENIHVKSSVCKKACVCGV